MQPSILIDINTTREVLAELARDTSSSLDALQLVVNHPSVPTDTLFTLIKHPSPYIRHDAMRHLRERRIFVSASGLEPCEAEWRLFESGYASARESMRTTLMASWEHV